MVSCGGGECVHILIQFPGHVPSLGPKKVDLNKLSSVLASISWTLELLPFIVLRISDWESGRGFFENLSFVVIFLLKFMQWIHVKMRQGKRKKQHTISIIKQYVQRPIS